MPRTAPAPLTISDLLAGLEDERWLGFGYLGERSHQKAAAQDRGDLYVLQVANEQGWTRDELIVFVVSRVGRHFGDLVFGGWSDAEVEAQLAGMLRWAQREGSAPRKAAR